MAAPENDKYELRSLLKAHANGVKCIDISKKVNFDEAHVNIVSEYSKNFVPKVGTPWERF